MKNLDLAERTLAYIKAHPEQHNQQIVATTCGTPSCFAGWMGAIDGLTMKELKDYHSPEGKAPSMWNYGAAGYLMDTLDITDDETCSIFSPNTTLPMLELMVKDLANDGKLRNYYDYVEETK